MADNDITCTVLGSECAWNGKFLKIDQVELQLPNGHTTTHDVVRHPGATAILALDGKGNMLMERQYRSAVDRVVWEIPAGKIDPDEDPAVCAARELEEETGYRAGVLRYLTPIAVALGYSDEIVHLFLATDLTRGETNLDEDEFVDVQWVPVSQVMADALAGKLEDSETLVALLFAGVSAE